MKKSLSYSDCVNLSSISVNQSNYLLSQRKITLAELSDNLPCWIHLNKLDDMTLYWMSGRMERDLHTNSADAIAGGTDFLRRIISPETEERVVLPLIHQRELGDENYTLSFVQMIRPNSFLPYKPYLTSTKISFKDNCYFCQSTPFNNIENSLQLSTGLLNAGKINLETYSSFQSLSKREKEILKFVASGETNKTIGSILSISHLTVKTHRQNIIKKLGTSSIRDLIKIAESFGLI